MKKRYVILPLVAVLAVVGYVFRSPAGALMSRSERIDAPAFAAMMDCIFDPVRELTFDIDGHRYTIPLPERTARFGDGRTRGARFLTETAHLGRYVKGLEAAGWFPEQMGSTYVITRRDSRARFNLEVRHFTAMYYVLAFGVVES